MDLKNDQIVRFREGDPEEEFGRQIILRNFTSVVLTQSRGDYEKS
jgi:hypothetical protein